ncbi:acyl-ACP--UDP-N-acetylglucosamine O-acyltransferase [Altericista sp. CCNU0014]|uniref:acyl-ACP--UDP-N-acetylglucosamine O-acyltransferase n=1 Tax=Altericista sp. CCNU0014 TaxID=3082949 RepID=UPI00384A9FE8
MISRIHPTAVIHPKAQLAEDIEVGPYAVIDASVSIGARTRVGAHVVIDGAVRIGEDNRIFPGATIGLPPQDVSYAGAQSWVEIGDRNQIREFVTVHRPTQVDAVTRIGNDNFLMAYAHIAHNCQIEDEVTIANAVGLGGYVQVGSKAVIGGMTGVHQFSRIGRLAMIGGMSRINRDVPPYLLVEGNPARIRGLNTVGLKRNGIAPESLAFKELKKAYALLYHSAIPFAKALEHLMQEASEDPVRHLSLFLQEAQQSGRRGVISGRGQHGRSSAADR